MYSVLFWSLGERSHPMLPVLSYGGTRPSWPLKGIRAMPINYYLSQYVNVNICKINPFETMTFSQDFRTSHKKSLNTTPGPPYWGFMTLQVAHSKVDQNAKGRDLGWKWWWQENPNPRALLITGTWQSVKTNCFTNKEANGMTFFFQKHLHFDGIHSLPKCYQSILLH